MVQRDPRETVLKNKEGQEDWTHFKKEILKEQEQTVPYVLTDKPTWKESCLAE